MFAPGSTIGRYAIRRHLGAGGMGDVYLAVDPALDRPVAVKVLPEALAADPARLARFVREARAASALNHPNIVTVFDVGSDAGTHYLVTEYVEGRTLRMWRVLERPSLDAILDAVAQAAMALDAAHAAGVVHRDVKPENLMVRRDGVVKVLDFGIAKLVGDTGEQHTSDSTATIDTRPGTILGTTRYMSPEQASGEAVDARADIWSLGVVLYELVAARAPFEGTNERATLASIVGREPEPLDVAAPGTPEAVSHIALRALRKDPAERYATASEMAAELTRAARLVRNLGGVAATQDDVATKELAHPALTPVASRATDDERSEATPPTNLPPRRTELIGRERELDELTALLRAGGERLVTLTGPGGTGKTRLAVEMARRLVGVFADGVFVVDLSSLTDPTQIVPHVGRTLGVPESPGVTPEDALVRDLSERRLLLLLDNFEHLLAGAPAVTRMLAAAPGLVVLATSRARLRLSEEHEFPVEPLEVPASPSLPPLEQVARAPAVALFVARARDAKPTFALTAENARPVVEICRRVDGLPLAIELAAARTKLLSPAALLERLTSRLRLLTGGARDLPTRQQTMRGAVAWSDELLDAPQRALLRRLAVFLGGCTLEAAESVCGSDGVDVLDAITSLVEMSLVRQRDQNDGVPRFTMLEVVREYALEQLDASGEAEATRDAHAAYFRRLAAEAEPEIRGPDQTRWIARLAREHDNFEAALSSTAEREPEKLAAFVGMLGPYWGVRSYQSDTTKWYTKALAAESTPAALRTRFLSWLSTCEIERGAVQESIAFARASVEAGRASDDRRALARALNGLGFGLRAAHDRPGADAAWEEALEIARALDDRHLASTILGTMGEAARQAGDVRAAREYYERALDTAGRHVRYLNNAIVLGNLGGLALEEGDMTAAAACYRESLSIAAELGEAYSMALALDGLAAVALDAGGRKRAALLAGAAQALAESSGMPLEPWEQSLRDRYVAKLRASLDAETLTRASAHGRAMTPEEAVDAARDV